MKKLTLLMLFLLSLLTYARAGEVGTKTFENITGYCENGKVTSIKEADTENYLVYVRVTYPLCRINGLRYRNIKFSYRTREEADYVAKQVKNINLDGYDIEINYDTRTIYTRY